MARRPSRSTGSGADAASGDRADQEWVVRAAGGDDGAFRRLVEMHQDRVYGVALRMLKYPDQALEASQDAFIKAYRGLSKFEARSSFGTWLYRITVNVCYDRLARRPEEPTVTIEELTEQGREPVAGADSAVEGGLESAEAAAAFEAALGDLPDIYRVPFVLRQVEERSYEEIAEILGISLTNAKVRVHRAREALLGKLRDRGVL